MNRNEFKLKKKNDDKYNYIWERYVNLEGKLHQNEFQSKNFQVK